MNHHDQGLLFGLHSVEAALGNPERPVEKVFLQKGKHGQKLFQILKDCRKRRIPVQQTGEARLRALTGTRNHQGAAAICGVKAYEDLDHLLDRSAQSKAPPLLLVADSVEDPRNLGALIRTAVASGVNGILLPKQGGVGLTAIVAKASAGSIEKMSFVRSRSISGDLQDLADKGFRIIGLEVGKGRPYREETFHGPQVIVVGGEHRGIRPHIRRCCHGFVTIPLHQKSHSLNLSVAAGILLFEIHHQRSQPAGPDKP